MSTEDIARLMIGDTPIRERAKRAERAPGPVTLELAGLMADGDEGAPVLNAVNLKVAAGEIVGIAGVSGNGQSQLVEVLSGQRPLRDGRVFVRDLSPLKGMPLSALTCGGTQAEDLTPLAGMKLTLLSCNDTAVSSLSPLEGMPLTVLWCNRTKVTDLSPLRGTPLKELRCDFVLERAGAILREIKTLTKINDTVAGVIWMRMDAAGGGKRR